MFWRFLSPDQQIPVVADLPVGDNLQDHIFTTLSFKDNTNSAASVAPSLAAVLRYLVFRSGLSISKHFDKPAFVSYILSNVQHIWRSSLLSIKRFMIAGYLSEPHLEASVFLTSDKQKPPFTQLTFASFQPHASVVDKYVEFLNLNPKVHTHKY